MQNYNHLRPETPKTMIVERRKKVILSWKHCMIFAKTYLSFQKLYFGQINLQNII